MGSGIIGSSDREGSRGQQKRDVLRPSGGQHGLDERGLGVRRKSDFLDAPQSGRRFVHSIGAPIGSGKGVASALVVAKAQGALRIGAFPQRLEGVDALGEGIGHGGFFGLTRGILHGDGSDLYGARVRHIGAGDHGFQTHCGLGVRSQACQHFQRILQAAGPVTGNSRGAGAVVGIAGVGEEFDEFRMGNFVRGEDTNAFVYSIETRLCGRPGVHPILEAGDHGFGRSVLEHAGSELSVPALGRKQRVKESGQRSLLERRGTQGRTPFGGHAPNASAGFVAVGMPEARLVVANEWIEPVAEVQGAIGTKAHINDAEGGVGRFHQGWQSVDLEGCSAGGEAESLDAVMKIPARHKFSAVLGEPVTVVGDIGPAELAALVPQRRMRLEVLGADHRLRKVGDAVAVAGEDEGLAGAVEGGAEGIVGAHGSVPEGVEPHAAGPESPEAGLVERLVAPGGFDAANGVEALAHHQFTGGAPGEGVEGLVGVASSEPAEDHAPHIGLAVAVGVLEEEQLVGRSHVNATIAEFQPERHVELVVEHGRPIGAAVMVGVFQYNDAIVRSFAGTDLGIAGGGGDPESTVAVEADLGGLDYAVGFAGEEANGVALGHVQGSQFFGGCLGGQEGAGQAEGREGRRLKECSVGDGVQAVSSHGDSTGGLECGDAGQAGGEGVGLLVGRLKERDELFHFRREPADLGVAVVAAAELLGAVAGQKGPVGGSAVAFPQRVALGSGLSQCFPRGFRESAGRIGLRDHESVKPGFEGAGGHSGLSGFGEFASVGGQVFLGSCGFEDVDDGQVLAPGDISDALGVGFDWGGSATGDGYGGDEEDAGAQGLAVEDPLLEAFREVFEVFDSVEGFALSEIEETDGGLGGGHLLKWAGIIDFAKLAENGVAFAGEVEDSQVVGGMGSDEECFPVGASGSGFSGAAADEGDDVVGAQRVSGRWVFRAEAPSCPKGSVG